MRFIYISFIALLAISCSQSKMLQKSLNKYKAPIGYLHDTKKANCNKSDSISIRLNNRPLDSITSVSKINGLVLPFLLFNYFETNMRVKLGQSSIEQQYNDFFASSLIEESKRTGCFSIINQNSNDTLYSLDITIDSCRTNSKYQRSSTILFLVFIYSVSFSELGFPAETYLQVSTKLRKGKTLITEKSYSVKRTQPFLSTRNIDTNKLRSDFTANMVESLSLCTKQCIEDIINDINISIQKK
jgi:hypothetical protein